MTEIRRFEIRADETGAVEGIVVKYGDVAVVSGQPERFEPGAFTLSAPHLNFMHDREQRLAQSVQLTDTPSALQFRAAIDEPYRDAIRNLIATGLIAGASMEFRAIKERMESGVRVIKNAVLEGIALVDTPAYPHSAGLAMRRADDSAAMGVLEYRQAAGVIAGKIALGVAGITSLARRRKLLIPKDAQIELADDIFLLDGYSYANALASTGAGSLQVRKTADAIVFATVAGKLSATPALRDFRAKSRANLVNGVVPGLQRISSSTHTDKDGFQVEVIEQAGVCELNTTARSGAGYSGSISSGRRRRR